MKKLLKILGIAAVVASLLPYRIERNQNTGERLLEALLWQVRTRPDHETGKTRISAVSILPNRLARQYGKEAPEDVCALKKEKEKAFPLGGRC